MSVRQVAAEAGVSERTAASALSCKKKGSLPEKLQTIADESAASGLSEATVARQRRLKADHPELWAEVEAGTKSTHSAAIAAGIVKVPSVLDQLRKIWAKATEAEREARAAGRGLWADKAPVAPWTWRAGEKGRKGQPAAR